ncbi:hypothetical protein NPIL_564061 [Nephila pilipes]|uniref:Uncharacterized protein n=1 Tax=Nephila pilipes TaxID=299642 RepID=A0A8X6PMC8_NEPPI|nr:hypothetical protein NPIL_564061 [Nephila pilipes]
MAVALYNVKQDPCIYEPLIGSRALHVQLFSEGGLQSSNHGSFLNHPARMIQKDSCYKDSIPHLDLNIDINPSTTEVAMYRESIEQPAKM